MNDPHDAKTPRTKYKPKEAITQVSITNYIANYIKRSISTAPAC